MSSGAQDPLPAAAERGVSIVIPTFREAENLPRLCARLDAVRREHDLEAEVLFMDDDSRDGSAEWMADHAPEGMRWVVRTGDPGLGPAVVEGIGLARHERLVVMDADLSHPPEKIPDMLRALDDGAELVIGSRYVAGGSTAEDWHWLRGLNSWVATMLARPLTRARDPMAGFLAFRKSLAAPPVELDPIGFKIGLEIIVKCDVRRIAEVPIRFADRAAGRSKLGMREQLRYLRHLASLYRHRFGRRRAAGSR